MRRILFLLIFGLAGLAILVALGSWQMRRLAWKENILADIEIRISADPVAVPVAPDRVADRYLPVVTDGEMDQQEVHVLVSRKQVGAGYRVISPFTLSDGRRVLVDRGFIATNQKSASREAGLMTVSGNLHWPAETDAYTPAPDTGGNIWFARDVPAIAIALDTAPVLIVARSDTDPAVTPLPVDTAAIPNDHLQYAITWFSLAVIWAAMTAYFLWRTRAAADEGQDR